MRTAAAVEWERPGERRFSIQGFYETRLMLVGSELSLHGATWSSFRHVLSTDREMTLFPDGFDPFDSTFVFSRFLVSYDCIHKYACGTFNSADSYGDDRRRRAVRQPLSLKEDVKHRAPYFADLLEQTYWPGSLVASREVLNPGRRYRDWINPPGSSRIRFRSRSSATRTSARRSTTRSTRPGTSSGKRARARSTRSRARA